MSRSFIFPVMLAAGAAVFCSLFLFAVPISSQAEEIVVYSSRIEQLIKPLFDAFTKETGITVKFTTDKEGALLTRLLAEGKEHQLMYSSRRMRETYGKLLATGC